MRAFEMILMIAGQAVIGAIMVIAMLRARRKLQCARDREYADICELVRLRLELDKLRKLSGLGPARWSADVEVAIADIADVEIKRRPLPVARTVVRPPR